MSTPSVHNAPIAIQHALADSLRVLVRLGNTARHGGATKEARRWAQIFTESLANYERLIPHLEAGNLPNDEVVHTLEMINGALQGLALSLTSPITIGSCDK